MAELARALDFDDPALAADPYPKPSDLHSLDRQTQAPAAIVTAPIGIAYRKEKDGGGAFFDHYTLQRVTSQPTIVLHQAQQATHELLSYKQSVTHAFPTPNPGQPADLPNRATSTEELGLLVIPGRFRANEFDPARKALEDRLINEARLRGQPILAICAGSWRLWEAYEGTLRTVTDHCSRRGMVHIGVKGNIVRNEHIHRLMLTPTSTVAAIMTQDQPGPFPVNSLHWKAADERKIPALLQVSARTLPDPNIAPTRHTGDGEKMSPDANSIEAFESLYGAPQIGIQWHLEAFNITDPASFAPLPHLHLINWLMEAGRTYLLRRRMVDRLKEHFRALDLE